MANFRKSFNLRNGVQVDDDNFIVNANGLVGIGTSVPIEILDVRGNTRIVGLLTASVINTPNLLVTGIGTFNTLTDGTVKISAGVITAISLSGVVTYYGDGKGLINIPTSQWVDVDPGAGTTSIYAAGRVGIATTNPIQPYFLHIGGNPDSTVGPNTGGVGINSRGNIKASGIITASTYFSGLHLGEINSSGISTFTVVRVGTGTNPPTVMTSGIITSTQFVGSLVGIATSALSLTGNPSIGVGTVTAIEVRTGLSTVGIITVITELDVGVGATAFTALNSGFIGIGTANPNSQLQIRKASNSLLEVISNTGGARISVGQSVGVGKSTGVIRFGTAARTFEILNNDVGNFSMYLHAGASGINTGRFTWNYGQTNAEIASLTYDGKFGIGITTPVTTLHVVGTSTVTGNANFGNDVTIVGDLNVGGNISLPPIISNSNIDVVTGISTFNKIEIVSNITLPGSATSIGIGTTLPVCALDVRNGRGLFDTIGIGTDVIGIDNSCVINGSIAITSLGYIGIGTTAPKDLTPADFGQIQVYTRTIDLDNSLLNVKTSGAIGFNTYDARSIFDYGNVGSATTRPVMIVPNISSTTRNGIGQTPAGSIIFNTTTSRFQGYTGVAWTDFH